MGMVAKSANTATGLGLIAAIGCAAYGQPDRSTNAPGATQAEFELWMTELSNWGRWGAADQLGAANLITPEKRLQAFGRVETGETVSLGHDLADEAGSDPNQPFGLDMIISFGPDRIRDRLDVDYHGGFFTHLDALCHVVYEGKIYNGHDFRQTVTDNGCPFLGITGLQHGVVTKAVLVDVPRLRGVPYLEPSTRVYREDIEEWEKQTGARVEPGDVLLIRTGRWARRTAEGDKGGTAGMDASFLPFLADRDVALFEQGRDDPALGHATFPGRQTMWVFPLLKSLLPVVVAFLLPTTDTLDHRRVGNGTHRHGLFQEPMEELPAMA